jgi:hypothetical protein
MLDLFGIDQSHLDQFIDGAPLGSDDEETLFKLLYRIPHLGADKIEAWSSKDIVWSDLARDPATHRVRAVHARGRATSVQRVPLSPEAADRLEFDHYYQVSCDVADVGNPMLVCTRKVPDAWTPSADLDERCSFYGLFLKSTDLEDPNARLVFAADRVAWHPDRVDASRGVGRSRVLLGELGMDVGLLDDARQANRRGLSTLDRECFYQMLAATAKADPDEFFSRAEGPFRLDTALTDPESIQGQLTTLRGAARRVQKIIVEDIDIRERFGIEHYYQVDIFMPLGDLEIRLGGQSDGESAPVYRNNYPVTICTLEVPDVLLADQDINENVDVAGFFFKLWAYKTDFVSAHDQRQRQPGPMLIGTAPRLLPPPARGTPVWGWVVGIGFLVALASTAGALWIYRLGDRRFERKILRPAIEGKGEPSLDNLEGVGDDKPDFSGLE